MRTACLLVAVGTVLLVRCATSHLKDPEIVPDQPETLVFLGTVVSIENAPSPRSRMNWVIKTRVDSVITGQFDGKHFDFRVHSPANSALELGKQFEITAVFTDNGYVVDQYQWKEQ